VGATQGWGAISDDRPGLKFESLWAPPGLLLVRWGDIGEAFYQDLQQVKHTTVLALVYRAKLQGSVRPNAAGMPRMRLSIPDEEVRAVLDATRLAVDGLFAIGARAIHIGISRAKTRIESREEAHALLDRRWKARDIPMTANHIFGSVPMSRDRRRGAVDMQGRLKGIDNLWIADASLFPSPSGVNPQATVMALSDIVTRRLADLPA
jgi:choline dehydrogenase-like flavoprotein